MLHFLDIFYTVVHVVLSVFNLTGWAWRGTRKLHLVTLTLTILSWALLGIWYGWGYCALTEWHWDVKAKLGERHLPNSFIKYIADRLTGSDIDSKTVELITLLCLVFAVLAAIFVNFVRPWLRKRNRAQNRILRRDRRS